MVTGQHPPGNRGLPDRLRLTDPWSAWPTSDCYGGASAGNSSRSRGRVRSVCVVTAIAAFLLGFAVGATLPALLMAQGPPPAAPPRRAPSSSSPAPPPSPYTTVSFVARAARAPDSSILDGAYWGDAVEATLPGGFDQHDADQWRRYTRNATVVQMKEGCGRMQNRLVVFSDGARACCRYRQNTDQIQGEVFSFYLGRVLGLRNLVPTSLGLVRSRDPKWSPVRAEFMLAQWLDDRPVVLTKYVDNLESARIPSPLRDSSRRLHPSDVLREFPFNTSREDALEKLKELAQWSDLIVFDYLTANLDRVVNNLYNLQWNSAMMDAPAHNLARNPADNLLIFLDNESGLLHGYRLLDKYEPHHSALLDALCVFRRSTADAIKRLHAAGDVGILLRQAFEQSEPEMGDYLPGLPERSVEILNERIARVLSVIEKCESLFPSENSV